MRTIRFTFRSRPKQSGFRPNSLQYPSPPLLRADVERSFDWFKVASFHENPHPNKHKATGNDLGRCNALE